MILCIWDKWIRLSHSPTLCMSQVTLHCNDPSEPNRERDIVLLSPDSHLSIKINRVGFVIVQHVLHIHSLSALQDTF